MTEFLAMGGYAAYVWSSFAITAVVMGANVYWARRCHALARQAARRRREIRQ